MAPDTLQNAASNQIPGGAPRQEPLLVAALAYAALGWPVFPLARESKAPRKGFEGGFHTATTDEATIQKWWGKWPAANIGIPTGAVSGFIALDPDAPKLPGQSDGRETLADLEREFGPLPETVTQKTPSGGAHYLFRHPGFEVKSRAAALGPKLDVKGDGGYVVVAPSRLKSGVYSWELAPGEIDIAQAPEWLIERLREPPRDAQPLKSADDEVIPQGRRHETLKRFAVAMKRVGLDSNEIEAALLAVNERRCRPPSPESEVRRIAMDSATWNGIARTNAQRSGAAQIVPELVRLDSIEAKPVAWLWRGWIPLGKITVLDGDPGLGKSALLCYLAAKVTTGLPIVSGDSDEHREPGKVILFSSEDDFSDTVRPRIEVMGGDLSRVFLPPIEGPLPKFPDNLPIIERWIEIHRPRLLGVDTFTAHLSRGNDSYKDQDVRDALSPVKSLAERYGTAVVFIRHLAKGGYRNPVYAGGGSIGIIGAARAGLLVAKDPDNPDRRILAVTKSNLAKTAESLAFFVRVDDQERAFIEFDGTSPHTAGALLSVTCDPEEPRALEAAKESLVALTADGPVAVAGVEEAAESIGVSMRTMRRAKKALRLKARKTRNGWEWEPPAALDALAHVPAESSSQ
jgi:hypothetical protein